MAKKDFDKYFNEQRQAYYQTVKALEEYGKLAADNMISTEQMKQAQSVLAPTVEAYKMLVYIKSILDRPVRNKKAKKYDNQNKKALNSAYNAENMATTTKELLKTFTEEYLHDERNTER